MSSTAQITANRQNSQKSTGPVTAEGKAASSQNNLRYGFRGAFRVYPHESQQEFDELIAGLRAEHQPATTTEEILVVRMAQHHWLALRAEYLFTNHPADLPFNEIIPELNLWLRYQTANQRAFHKCLSDLLKLRAERRNTENGFERQRREEAEHSAKQEAHAAQTKLANAKTEAMELDTTIKSVVQAAFPGTATLDLNDLKAAIAVAMTQVAEARNLAVTGRE